MSSKMLAIPGLSRASSSVTWVARGVGRARLSGHSVFTGRNQQARWGLVVRCCSTLDGKDSEKPAASSEKNVVEGMASLIALWQNVKRDSHGNWTFKDRSDIPKKKSVSKEESSRKKSISDSKDKKEKVSKKHSSDSKKKEAVSSKDLVPRNDKQSKELSTKNEIFLSKALVPKKDDKLSTKVKKVSTLKPRDTRIARKVFNLRFDKPERLSKVMAAAGVASRRACEDIIFAGKVVVNGKVCRTPETRVDPLKDLIYIDGKPIPRRLPPKMVFAVYKPKGFICSEAKEDKKSVGLLLEDYLNLWKKRNPGITPPRIFTVGRLDVATTGLILMTNDGEFAHKVAHPSFGLTKEYIVTVVGKVTRRQFNKIVNGVEVDGAMCLPLYVELLKPAPGEDKKRLRVIVSEGRNHEVRKLVENALLEVYSLKRVRIGGLRIPSRLKAGQFIQLTEDQVKQVLEQDPLSEDQESQPAQKSSSTKEISTRETGLMVPEKRTRASIAREKYPLVKERKDVQAVIESSNNKKLMLEGVAWALTKEHKYPTRRVRRVVMK